MSVTVTVTDRARDVESVQRFLELTAPGPVLAAFVRVIDADPSGELGRPDPVSDTKLCDACGYPAAHLTKSSRAVPGLSFCDLCELSHLRQTPTQSPLPEITLHANFLANTILDNLRGE